MNPEDAAAVYDCSTDDGETSSPAGGLPTLIYDVVRHRGYWRVLHIGKYSEPHASQSAAIDAAMAAALERQAAGRTVAVRLNRTDGQIFHLVIELQRT